MATKVETTDAAGGTSTTYNMSVGDEFFGAFEGNWDSDWVKVTLTKDVWYDIFVDPTGDEPANSPYVRLYDATGTQIVRPYMASEHESLIHFTPTETGIFFISVADYVSYIQGIYRMSVTEHGVTTPDPLTKFSHEKIAKQLTHGYWKSKDQSWRAFDVSDDNRIVADISDLTAKGKKLAKAAMKVWETVTGIDFRLGFAADIVFDDEKNGANTRFDLNGHEILLAKINVDKSWISKHGDAVQDYTFYTYLHEIGHALGLGHAGKYNLTGTYKEDGTGSNHFLNDSYQETLMSYFNQKENTFINATKANPITPMLADILAIQKLYPTLKPKHKNGDTIYDLSGKNTPIKSSGLDVNNKKYAFTLFDTGGEDTFDASASNKTQRIDLKPGSIWNVDGNKGTVVVALKTIIENVIGGSAKDIIKGNGKDNKLAGRGGQDELFGKGGRDELFGQDGRDRIIPGKGNDKMKGGAKADVFVFGPQEDSNVIYDFENGLDRIDLTKFGFANKAQALDEFFEWGTPNDDKLSFKHQGTLINIRGMDMGDLNGADIIV